MYLVTVLSALWILAIFVGYGLSMTTLGVATVQALPAGASVLLARRIRGGGRRLLRGIIVLQAVWIFFALGRLGQGDGTGVLGLIIPVTVLILVTRESARRYFDAASRMRLR